MFHSRNKLVLTLALCATPVFAQSVAEVAKQEAKAADLAAAAKANVTINDYVQSQKIALAIEIAKANAAGIVLTPAAPKATPKAPPPPPPSEPALNGAMVGRDGRFVAEIMYEGRLYLARVNERIGSTPWTVTKGSRSATGIDVAVSKISAVPTKNRKTGAQSTEFVTDTRYFHIASK